MSEPLNIDADDTVDVDPLDIEAAEIDVRAEDAPEQIEELIAHAADLGRDVSDAPLPPAD